MHLVIFLGEKSHYLMYRVVSGRFHDETECKHLFAVSWSQYAWTVFEEKKYKIYVSNLSFCFSASAAAVTDQAPPPLPSPPPSWHLLNSEEWLSSRPSLNWIRRHLGGIMIFWSLNYVTSHLRHAFHHSYVKNTSATGCALYKAGGVWLVKRARTPTFQVNIKTSSSDVMSHDQPVGTSQSPSLSHTPCRLETDSITFFVIVLNSTRTCFYFLIVWVGSIIVNISVRLIINVGFIAGVEK